VGKRPQGGTEESVAECFNQEKEKEREGEGERERERD
jgi:hypothetical protein